MSSVAIPWYEHPEEPPQSEAEEHCQRCFLLWLRDLGSCPHCMDDEEEDHSDSDAAPGGMP